MDGVHLEVAGFGMVEGGLGKVVEHALGGVVAGWVGGGCAAWVFLPVMLVGEWLAVFVQEFAFGHAAINGAAAWDVVGVRGLVERLQCVGDALLLGIFFRKVAHKVVGDFAAGAFVRGAPAGLLRGEGRA